MFHSIQNWGGAETARPTASQPAYLLLLVYVVTWAGMAG